MLVMLFLLVNYQGVPVLQCIFGATVEILDYLRPFLGTLVLLNAF